MNVCQLLFQFNHYSCSKARIVEFILLYSNFRLLASELMRTRVHSRMGTMIHLVFRVDINPKFEVNNTKFMTADLNLLFLQLRGSPEIGEKIRSLSEV